MGRLVRKTSFTGGEIDEALFERSNLEKVQAGLETARNVIIKKNGRLSIRAGTIFQKNAKANTGNVLLIEIPNTDWLLEVSDQNIRRHTMSTGTFDDVVSDFTDSDIPNLDYTVSSKYATDDGGGIDFEENAKCVIFYLEDNDPVVFNVETPFFPTPPSYNVTNELNPVGTSISNNVAGTGTPSGPNVDYGWTVVKRNGEEGTLETFSAGAPTPFKLPVSATQYNTLTITWSGGLGSTAPYDPVEIRFFRRPEGGGAYGYIGSTFERTAGSGTRIATFIDSGQIADYSVNPPEYVSPINTITSLGPKTGIIVQGRQLLGNVTENPEYIYGSKTNFPFNFTRDYPLAPDSAVLFKSGQTGAAEVLKFADVGAVVAFTSIGIYSNQRGPITPDNIKMNYVGSAIINEKLPPLKVDDALVFVDKRDNSVKVLDFSNNRQNYSSDDLTVFSNHLFEGKEIVSWAYQKKGDPIIWCVMDDGSVVALTYNPSQDMRACTRVDFDDAKVIAVSTYGTGVDTGIVFMVERNGVRTLQKLANNDLLSDKEKIFSDNSVTKSINLAAQLGYPLRSLGFTFTPLTPQAWSGDVRLDSVLPSVFTSSMVGKVYRMFDKKGQAIDFLVKSVPAGNQMILGPNPENPYDEISEQYRTDIDLYETFTEMTGLSHLNGENVSVYSDGNVISSPLNDVENLPNRTVLNGVLTVPRSAFCTVGLPFVWDVGTYEISSDDPNVSVKARTTGSVFIKTHKSKGFYVGPAFPENDSVQGMQTADMFEINHPQNASLPPKTKRYEVPIPNDWKSNGRVCIRGCDPVPFELLSIIANVTLS